MRLKRAKKSPFYTEIVKFGLILTHLKVFVAGGANGQFLRGKCPMPPVASPMQPNESGHVDGHVDFFVSGVLSKTEEFSCIILSSFVKKLYNIRCCRHLFHYVIVIHNKKHDVHSAWVSVPGRILWWCYCGLNFIIFQNDSFCWKKWTQSQDW